jgi:ribonuclease HIII
MANDIERSKYIVNDKLTQQKIEDYLSNQPGSLKETEQNCIYRSKITSNGQTVYVRQFIKGTLTIDGPNPLFAIIDNGIRPVLGVTAASIVMNPSQKKLEQQIKAVQSINLGDYWIGTDEAGKGDYFGPLVAAAVLANNDLAGQLAYIGVKDSKLLSDSSNQELARKINSICGKRAQVVTIPPSRYNELYEQFHNKGKNLNALLAWAHSRALENILSIYPQSQITVIIDKFADEKCIRSNLLQKSRSSDLNLVLLPKAEANIAVAAASILARASFLNWFERTSKSLNICLPKGASGPNIVQIAKQITHRLGAEKLAKIAKLHFKTTKGILP